MPLIAGTRLGVYEIRGPLGAGGMGEVYLAHDTRLGRQVAVKVLPPDVSNDPERLARFEREARAVAALNHPGIVTLHAVEEAAGVRFLVMERVSGRTLAALIGRDGLPIGRILELAVPMADALAAAHDRGVVHRDLKPNNVMVTDEGRLKILDFGLAKIEPPPASDGEGSTTTFARTGSGQILGTIPYMAPEQCRGERVDTRADLFAFGAILYEMASGTRAFGGESSVDIMTAVLKDDPRPLETLRPGVPSRFARIVKRCLEKDPRHRIQSAIDLKHELEDLADELRPAPPQPVAASAGGGPTPLARRARRLLPAIVVGVALAGLLIVGTMEALRWRDRAATTGAVHPIRSLAVLPFENRMRDASQDYFVDGMHDALITELVRLGGVEVKSRNVVMRFRGTTRPVTEVAHELGVDAVVDGSVLRSGQSVRIDAKLVLGSNDQHVWARSYEREMQDVLSLLRDVSGAIAAAVRARVGEPAPAPVTASGEPVPLRVKPEAYEAFLKARYLFNQSLAKPQVLAAREMLATSTAIDPSFAPAWSGLATTYVVDALFGYGPRLPAIAKGREMAQRALDLSPDEGTALAVQGMLQLYFDWDFEGARARLDRAVALRPHDWVLRHGWADYLMVTGRYDESLEQTRLGRTDDPTSTIAAQIVAFHAIAARRFGEAIADGRQVLLLNPTVLSAHQTIGTALWQQERYDEAVAELKLASSGDPESWRVFDETYRSRGPQAALRVYSRQVAAALVRQADPRPVDVAAAFAQAGEPDRAIEWLERAYTAREPSMLHVPANVAFETLRDDARFQGLLRRIGMRMPPRTTRTP